MDWANLYVGPSPNFIVRLRGCIWILDYWHIYLPPFLTVRLRQTTGQASFFYYTIFLIFQKFKYLNKQIFATNIFSFLFLSMACSSAMLHNMCSVSPYSPKCYNHNRTLALTHSKFLSSTSFLRFKRKALSSDTKLNEPASPKPSVYALQSNFFKGLLFTVSFFSVFGISIVYVAGCLKIIGNVLFLNKKKEKRLRMGFMIYILLS